MSNKHSYNKYKYRQMLTAINLNKEYFGIFLESVLLFLCAIGAILLHSKLIELSRFLLIEYNLVKCMWFMTRSAKIYFSHMRRISVLKNWTVIVITGMIFDVKSNILRQYRDESMFLRKQFFVLRDSSNSIF